MMVRGTRRLASGLALGLVLLTVTMVYYGPNLPSSSSNFRQGSWSGGSPVPSTAPPPPPEFGSPGKNPADPLSSKLSNLEPVNPEPHPGIELATTQVAKQKQQTTTEASPRQTEAGAQKVLSGPTKFVADTHREIYSQHTSDGQYWLVDFSPYRAYNPNFVPHPTKNDTWITVAQTHKVPEDNQVWFTQLVCEAKFHGGKLKCTHPPLIVPVPPTWSTKCEGEIAHFNLNIGPHDARVFFGPKKPYILYGTQSAYNCFGQWFQDFTLLVDWPEARAGTFRYPTEVQRPPPYHYERVEKNWFLFWDMNDQIYAHHDIHPKRVFGKMNDDGAVDKDLATITAAQDEVCLKKRMPSVKPTIDESIHQATNSLAVTLCKRKDPSCVKSESNTFVFTIFHWKSFYEFHGLYEPYVLLFRQAPPFEIYAITSKPIWFRGRRLPGEWREEGKNGWNQTEMVYTTSIAWKEHGLTYHGYLDDTLFLGFGVEDKETAGMDLPAAEILQDIKLCDDNAVPPNLTL